MTKLSLTSLHSLSISVSMRLLSTGLARLMLAFNLLRRMVSSARSRELAAISVPI